MKFKYKQQIIGGGCTGIIVWIVLTIADAFDELIINNDSFTGVFVFFAMPIIMFVCYAIHYIRRKPKKEKLLVWFGSFYTVCLPLWWIIYNMICENTYIIEQKRRTDWLNLNGIEYIFYGYSVLVGFSVLCSIFHGVYIVIKIKYQGNKAH